MALRLLPRSLRPWARCYAASPASATATTAAAAATTAPSPPLLLRIRSDLKTALQAKDRDRLAVLRAVLTEALHASKTTRPLTADVQVLTLLRKAAQAGRAAAAEFRDAGRHDLADKEDRQVDILEEYAACVETAADSDIAAAARDAVRELRAEGNRALVGDVLRRVLAPDALGKKPVERATVAAIVKKVLEEP